MEYNNSDKFGVVLACLAGVMAIVLSLIEKSLLSVVTLLILVVLLAVYPVMHFIRRGTWRVVALLAVMVCTVLFGYSVWPHKEPTKENQITVMRHDVEKQLAPEQIKTDAEASATVQRNVSPGGNQSEVSAAQNQTVRTNSGEPTATATSPKEQRSVAKKKRPSPSASSEATAPVVPAIGQPQSVVQVGGPGPVAIEHNYFGPGTPGVAVLCPHQESAVADLNGCRNVEVRDNYFGSNAPDNSAFQNSGEAERIFIADTTVATPPGGSAHIVQNLPGGKITDLTIENSHVLNVAWWLRVADSITAHSGDAGEIRKIFDNVRQECQAEWKSLSDAERAANLTELDGIEAKIIALVGNENEQFNLLHKFPSFVKQP